MRETIANLTAVMEAIATDADNHQRTVQRDASNNRSGSGFGLNSQNRAALKALMNQEKAFSGLMEQLRDQFMSFKD